MAAACSGGVVVMGCDSSNTDSHGRVWPEAGKVLAVPVDGPVVALLGHAGSATTHARLRRLTAAQLPDEALEPDEWADALARVIDGLARADPSTVDEDGEVPSNWLLARLGRLWLLRGDFARVAGPYQGIGSGGDLALGVLFARLDGRDDVPEAELRAAVAQAVVAGLRFDDGCHGEVELHRLPAR